MLKYTTFVNKIHLRNRNKVDALLKRGFSIEDIAKKFHILIGTRYIRKSAKWYKFCIRAKENQKKAIEKHPNLYSKAGKIAQKKHPWIGRELGKKYGAEQGRINSEKLKKIPGYFSRLAKRLQKINPEHSRNNMKKAHETMKRNNKFIEHQKEAALRCMKKNPNQLKEMSRKAHKLYPLALLALNSRRENYPYEFGGCFFDSDSERKLCKIFVESGLIKNPIEEKNIHFRINKCHIDFFIKSKIFVEFHPSVRYEKGKESVREYYIRRRSLLDKNGYGNYPLIVIDRLRNIEPKINKIKELISFKGN